MVTSNPQNGFSSLLSLEELKTRRQTMEEDQDQMQRNEGLKGSPNNLRKTPKHIPHFSTLLSRISKKKSPKSVTSTKSITHPHTPHGSAKLEARNELFIQDNTQHGPSGAQIFLFAFGNPFRLLERG